MNISETPALDAYNASVSNPARMFQEMERLRSKARHDEAQALSHAKYEERLTIAKKLLQTDMPVDKIIIATGLTREKVEGLLATD